GLYPAVGAAVAGVGAILLSQVHAEPVLVTICATVLFVALGWLVGTKEDILRETASTDPLTGVANRRSFDQRLARGVAEAMRSGQPLTLLFVDVDHLKVLNDGMGHAVGDQARRLAGGSMGRARPTR